VGVIPAHSAGASSGHRQWYGLKPPAAMVSGKCDVSCETLDEGMKEVLVYSRTNTDGHVDREKVPKIEVEVDLAGSHSRLALGTESPLSDPKNS
jgi:hypothetical protein